MNKLKLALATMVLTFSTVCASAAEEWNLASRLPAKVFHETNLAQFVTEV